MTPEQAAITSAETLKRIERLLASSSSTVGSGRGESVDRAETRKIKATKETQQDFSKQLGISASALKTFSSELDETTGALKNFRRELGITASSGAKIHASGVRSSKRLSTAQNAAARAAQVAGTNLHGAGQAAHGVSQSNVEAANAADKMEKSSKGMTGKLIDMAAKTGITLAGLKEFAVALKQVSIQLSKDFLTLQSRGINNTVGGLGDFYKRAILAGMSLEEYTTMLENSTTAVARVDSIEHFNRSIERSADQLENLGVFGAKARNLAAALDTSATTLGIPQSKLADATTSQIAVFEQLRKTTMLSSDQMLALAQELGANQDIQQEMLGLAPKERAARMGQLMQIQTMGQSMGMAAEQSQRLAQVLLAQRRATAKERFEARGRLAQAGALVGMSGADTAELSRLGGKKFRTADEEKRFVELSGQLQQGLQRMQASGNFAAENIADQVQQYMPAMTQAQLEQAGAAKLQAESGEVVNKDFGQATTDFGKFVGNFGEFVTGLMKSPLGGVMDALFDLGAFIAGSLIVKSGLTKALAGAGGAAASGAAVGGAATGAAKAAAAAKASSSVFGPVMSFVDKINESTRLTKPTMGFADSVKNAIKSFGALKTYVVQSTKGLTLNMGTVVTNIGDSLSNMKGGLGTFSQSLKGLSFSGFFSNLGTTLKSFNWGGLAGSTLNGLKGIGTAFQSGSSFLFKMATRFAPLGAIIGGIEEAFTGDLAAAMGFGDGIVGRISGVVFGAFRGLITGLPALFDWVFNSISEGLGFSFKVNSEGMVDSFLSLVSATFKNIAAGFVGVLASAIDAIPFVSSDAPWVKSLRATQQSLVDSADQDFKNMEDLYANATDSSRKEKMTLKTIGKEMRESSEKDKKAVASNIKDTSSKVVSGYEGLLASAKDTTQRLQAQAAGEAEKEHTPVAAAPARKEDQTVAATPARKEDAQAETKVTADASSKTGKIDFIKATRLEVDSITAKASNISLAGSATVATAGEHKSQPSKTAATPQNTKTYAATFIADQPVVKDTPLTEKQLAVMKLAKGMGNSYPDWIEQMYKSQVEAVGQVKEVARQAAVQATPTVQSRPTVTPPEVNKTDAVQSQETKEAPPGALQPSDSETVTISRRQLEVLQAIHQAILQQPNMDEEIVAKLEQNGRKNPLTANLVYNRVVS